MADKPQIIDDYFNHSEVARALRCTRQRIHNAVIAGLEQREDGKVSISAARKWFKEKHAVRLTTAELRDEKLRAEIAKHKAAHEMTELELARMRKELRPVKEVVADVGQLLTTVWLEITAFPHRIQTAFPQVPNLEKTATDIINDSVKKLHDFAKENGAEIK